MISTVLSFFTVWIALAAQAPPQQPPVFRSGATLVPIDVKVLDSKGKPITDLKLEDFAVFDDGVQQPVKYFSATTMTTEPASGAPVKLRAASRPGVLQPQTSRVFLLVLGRGRLQPPSKGVDAAIQFVLERALPQDQVSVFAWNRATDFTTDHAAIASLLVRFRADHERIDTDLNQWFGGLRGAYGDKTIPSFIQKQIDRVFDQDGVTPHSIVADPNTLGGAGADIRKRMDALQQSETNAGRIGDFLTDAIDPVAAMGLETTFDEYARQMVATGQDVATVYAGIEYLRLIDGEKHLVFITEHGMALPRFDHDIAIARAATNARVAIDTIQTGGASSKGLVSAIDNRPVGANGARGPMPPPAISFDAMFNVQSIRTLSELTGGQSSVYDYASNGLRKIDEATRSGYLLAYESAHPPTDRRYHKIEVKVVRKGAKVLYRHGYSARRESPTGDRREMMGYIRMAQAMAIGAEVRDIPLGFTTKDERDDAGNVILVNINIGIKRVAFTHEPDAHRASLDLAVMCGDREEKVAGQASQRVNIVLSDAQYARAQQNGVDASVRVSTGKSMAVTVKVIAYDFEADVLGSVTRQVRPR